MSAGIWVCRSVRIINPDACFFFLIEGNKNRETCIQTGKYGSTVGNGGTEDTILISVPGPDGKIRFQCILETQGKLVFGERVLK